MKKEETVILQNPLGEPTPSSFEEFFVAASGHRPYSFQRRLAEAVDWPKMLRVPTGAGKTAAVILAWLWRRRFHPDISVRRSTPRRLVYCLPMRSLIEQCRDVALSSLKALGLGEPDEVTQTQRGDRGIGFYVIRGGDLDNEWHLYPERDAIIIGTQDMLLSRVLNRGYGLSRFQWPVSFGLLNSDCLWILDEVPLMGAGLTTTAQLSAFRDRLGVIGPCKTLWMSAAMQPSRLTTADHQAPSGEESIELSNEDINDTGLATRLYAPKCLKRLSMCNRPSEPGYPLELAMKVALLHEAGSRTIVALNSVQRAQAVYRALLEKTQNPFQVLLLHSRFRPPEQQEKINELQKPIDPSGPGQILITTQVLEAGMDLSSTVLVTELASWPSMVQRFGRCNRYGEHQNAAVYWIDLVDQAASPYAPDDLHIVRLLLEQLEGRSITAADLPDLQPEIEDSSVIRMKDIIDLSDTAAALSGNDVEVGKFIGNVEGVDVLVSWRQWETNKGIPKPWARPISDELCAVPFEGLRSYLKEKKVRAWAWDNLDPWDHLDRRWHEVQAYQLRPGQVLVLHSSTGGYDSDLGWYPPSKKEVHSLEPERKVPRSHGVWLSLEAHSKDVANCLERILKALEDRHLEAFSESLLDSAWWHDVGKVHPVFQDTLLACLEEPQRSQMSKTVWVKAPKTGPHKTQARPHFRHELASLLTLLCSKTEQPLTDLALYLVASHHGRVRFSIYPISDLSQGLGENSPGSLLGIVDGDELPEVNVGEGRSIPATKLDLGWADTNSGSRDTSWLSRSLALRDSSHLGPFRLAYLEALLRAADARASKRASKRT